MYSIAGPAYLRISAFRGRALRETGIPPDGNENRTAVHEINRQRVVLSDRPALRQEGNV
jgi:hypothetical protein